MAQRSWNGRTVVPAVVATTISAAYAVAGVVWAAGGPGFPFGRHDPQAIYDGALLAGATPAVAGPVIALLGLAGTAAAIAMLRGGTRWRPLLIGFGVLLAVSLSLVLPGRRAIIYLPPLGLLAVLRPPNWGTVNHLVPMVAGFAWAALTLGYARRSAGRCARCGDRPVEVHDRWRVPVTWVAMLAPWLYASSRLCWALGIPLGVPPEFLDRINAANPGNTTLYLELFLVTITAAGSALTWGLIRPWGVVFPRRSAAGRSRPRCHRWRPARSPSA